MHLAQCSQIKPATICILQSHNRQRGRVVIVLACHPGDRGSNPSMGYSFYLSHLKFQGSQNQPVSVEVPKTNIYILHTQLFALWSSG